MCTCSGSRIPINGQINIHVSVSEEHCARGQAQALWRFLAKRALFSHSREMLRKTSIVFLFFSAAPKYS